MHKDGCQERCLPCWCTSHALPPLLWLPSALLLTSELAAVPSRPLQEAAQWREKAEQCAAAFAERLSEAAIALPQLACGLYLLTLGHPRQVSCGLPA